MLEKYNRYKLLKVFLDNPLENFRLRELSRMSKISPPSVIAYLKEFEKENLIKKITKRDIPFYVGERENPSFMIYKKISIIFELNNQGLVEFLWENLSPKAIILFGSFAKGESTESSDIDLFIYGKEKVISIKEYEKNMKKHIHIIFNDDLKDLSSEFKNNLLNGIVLKGYIKVFK